MKEVTIGPAVFNFLSSPDPEDGYSDVLSCSRNHSSSDYHFTNCTLVNGTEAHFVFSELDSLIAW